MVWGFSIVMVQLLAASDLAPDLKPSSQLLVWFNIWSCRFWMRSTCGLLLMSKLCCIITVAKPTTTLAKATDETIKSNEATCACNVFPFSFLQLQERICVYNWVTLKTVILPTFCLFSLLILGFNVVLGMLTI